MMKRDDILKSFERSGVPMAGPDDPVYQTYTRFRTDLSQNNYTPNNSPAMTDDNGGVMNSRNIAADTVWTRSLPA